MASKSRKLNRNRRNLVRKARRRPRRPAPAAARPAVIEALEDRILLSAVFDNLGLPELSFNNGGTTTYDAQAGVVAVDAAPLSYRTPTSSGPFFSGDVDLSIQVDNAGNLLGGVSGDDLVVSGDLDVNGDFIVDLSGVMLTGEVKAFGFEELGPSDSFTYVFEVTGGLLAGDFAGKDLGVALTIEQSTFNNDFAVDFGGGAKGAIGAVDPPVEPASLGDRLWNDADIDGVQDANEPGIGGATVTLLADLDDDGQIDDVAGTTTTADGSGADPVGFYAFDGLTPGVEYQVSFDLPSGFDSFTAREAGSDETVDSDVDGGGLSRVVVLGPGEDNPTIDAGVFQFGAQATASLGDRLFHDLDADGVQDAGEPGIGGSTVTLLADTDNDGQVDDPLATTTTADGTGADPAGFYRFDDLAPDAAYRVEFALPSGFDSFTARDAGSDDTVDSDVDAAGLSQVVTLDADEFDPSIDAGVFNTAALGDFVFEDLDGDGLQDADEPGVGGVTVTLSGAGPDGLLDTSDDTTAQQLTDGDGEYLFEGLTPGEPYRVNFSGLPAGFSFTAPDAGDEAADSDADLASGDAPAVTLASGERDLTIDAGILAPAGLGDFVWRDADADGVQEAGEPGIAGVVVELLDANDQVIAATTTDGSGLYRFTGLEPGTYSTRVAAGNFDAGQPLEGLFITKLDAGLDDAVDSDGDPAEALAAAATTLVSGQFDPTLDFGFFATGIELVKAGPETAVAGETIEYEFTVTNTGDVALGGVVVDDPLLSGSPIVVGDLAAGESRVVTGAYTVPAAAGRVVIDFEADAVGASLAVGDVIDDEYAAYGLTVTTDNPSNQPAMIFDSSNPTGGDYDLGTPNVDFGGPGVGSGGSSGTAGENSRALDNILIISEDGDSGDPDDDARGGSISFLFDAPRFVDSVDILDVDSNEPGSTIEAYDANGVLLASSPILNLSNNSFQSVAIDTPGVSELRVNFVSSGAVAELVLGGEAEIVNTAAATGDPVDPNGGDLPDVRSTDDHVTDIVAAAPGIDIEKSTNGVDADAPADAPEIAPGEPVTWTYEVTNTGNVPFTFDQVGVVDDNGTANHAGDDFAPTFLAGSDDGGDLILSPGERWSYEATAAAEAIAASTGQTTWLHLTGNSPLDGPDGNVRTFDADGLFVNASAFSRDSHGDWSEAYLGVFGGGLGVTDAGEGDGGNGTHRADNLGEQNFILFEFSETVVVDKAFLDSVVHDSDINVWIGSAADPFNNHLTLSDGLLDGLTKEADWTGSGNSRWADFNGGALAGNVLVLAPSVDDATPEDRFKVRKVVADRVAPGVYGNTATATAPGAADADASHYTNPAGAGDSDGSIAGGDGAYQAEGGMVAIDAADYDDAAAGRSHEWRGSGKSGSTGEGALTTDDLGVNNNHDYESDSPRLDYKVNFAEAGTYYVWVRGSARDGADNSIHAGLNGEGQYSANRISQHADGDWGWTNATMDGPRATIHVDEAGVQAFNLWMREDGYIVDKVVLTSDPHYRPDGEGPEASSRGVGLASSVAAAPTTTALSGRDIGGVRHGGSYEIDGDRITIEAGGDDIWNRDDEFHFASQVLEGDGEIVARVTGVEETHNWAKAGVMIRETLDDDSAHAFMALTADRGSAFQRRVDDGHRSRHTSGGHASDGLWVKLVREGDLFTGYQSTDGVAWHEVGRQHIDMADSVHIGLAATAHNDRTLATATFDNVSVNGLDVVESAADDLVDLLA